MAKRHFLEWLSSPFDPSASSDSLLARIYFFGELPEEIRREQLGAYERYHQQVLRKLQTIEKRFSASIVTDRDYFELSTLYLGLQQVQGSIRWLRYISEQRPLAEFVRRENEGEHT